MFSTADTIVAIATPAGRGAIGVVRLSGPDAQGIVAIMRHAESPLLPRHATFSRIRSADDVVDHAIVTLFPAPHSYTGDDVVEVSAHGSQVILRAIVASAVAAGARLAGMRLRVVHPVELLDESYRRAGYYQQDE